MFVAVCTQPTALRVSGGVSIATVTMADALAKLPDVEIDPEGTFKYILLRVSVKDGDANKVIVRGTKSAEYHSKSIGNGRGSKCVAYARATEMCKRRRASDLTATFGHIYQHDTHPINLILV